MPKLELGGGGEISVEGDVIVGEDTLMIADSSAVRDLQRSVKNQQIRRIVADDRGKVYKLEDKKLVSKGEINYLPNGRYMSAIGFPK